MPIRRLSLFLSLALLAAGSVRKGALSGRVADELGQPIYGVRITLDGVCGVLTDTTGHFTFARVASGRHRILAEFDGYSSRDDSVTIVADDTVRVALDLWPLASRRERDSIAVMVRNLLTLSGHEPNTYPIGVRHC
jgi:hypothetical protein